MNGEETEVEVLLPKKSPSVHRVPVFLREAASTFPGICLIAAFGMVGLETALSVVVESMVNTGLLDWVGVADRMSYRPAHIGP